MIFKFIEEDYPAINLGKDIDEIQGKLFDMGISTLNIKESMSSLILEEDKIKIHDSDMNLRVTKKGFDQWLQRSRIPLSYAYDIPFDMLWYNLERRSKQYNRSLLIRIRNDSELVKSHDGSDIIRAFLTDRYKPLQNSTCFIKFKDAICWAGMSISKAMVSEDIFQVLATGNAKIDNDIITGIEMVNGETGHRSFEVNTILMIGTSYVIIRNSKETSQFNLKASHLKNNIKDLMVDHTKNIIDNLDTFKKYVEASKRETLRGSESIALKDKLDLAIGRADARVALESMQNKTKFEACKLLAELGDDINDTDKQRLIKMAAGSLII